MGEASILWFIDYARQISPTWFWSYEIGLQAVIAIIAFLVAFYSFKIYRLSEERRAEFLGIGFLLMACSYGLKSLLNLFILLDVHTSLSESVKIQVLRLVDLAGLYLFEALLILGLVFLALVTTHEEDKKVFWLLLTISLAGILLSPNPLYGMFVISAVLLAFISILLWKNYLASRDVPKALTASAFTLLFIGSIHYIFSFSNSILYVLGQGLELLAYILILLNLYVVRRK